MQPTEFTKEENFSFFKNLILFGIFIFMTPLTLGISLFSLYSLKFNNMLPLAPVMQNNYTGVHVFASLPENSPSVSGNFTVSDARSAILKNYLSYYESPLANMSDFIVTTSDKYNLDYRLLVAIAQQESNLCKVIPQNSYNCWGWGINSQSNLSFSSYEEGIETVAYGLKTQYIDKGYKTIDQIMDKYNPNSPQRAWAKSVSEFMSVME